MAKIDLSRQRKSLLSDSTTLDLLPRELVLIVQDHQSRTILDAVASAALQAPLTCRLFAHFEPVFADICARWLNPSTRHDPRVLASFARILPFAPYLSVFLARHLRQGDGSAGSSGGPFFESVALPPSSCRDDDQLILVLLALWRLKNFDKREYGCLSKPSHIQSLLGHPSPAVRCLAVRIFCQLHHAADVKLEAMLAKHAPRDTGVFADLDGVEANYAFLSLYEEARREEILALLRRCRGVTSEECPVLASKTFLESTSPSSSSPSRSTSPPLPMQTLTPLVLCYGKTLLPRPLGPVDSPATLALTPTTVENLEGLAAFLQRPGPILLHGLSGSGKTALVQEVARELDKRNTLVTLHLNEQTDAKLLLGLYTTDAKPGSFQWRAGVLTKAVREGRWVLIEDLDRAPTEVMSTLLPLIERGELLIPGRGERIRAPSDFRIFATVRTSLGMNDKESLPSLIGMRLWQLLHVKPLARDDLKDVVDGRYPLLQQYTSDILTVYDHLLASTARPGRSAGVGQSALERPLGTRDLLKWCGRLDYVLRAAGCVTGKEPISDTTRDRMFFEAVDCFVGSVKDASARTALIAAIAREMHLSTERVEHYLTSYMPDLQDSDTTLTIGRISFVKPRRKMSAAASRSASSQPFAATTHAKRLLEQIASAVRHREPVLLVGETGIGKTTVVQRLAASLGGRGLVAVNLSQQSEAGDLLGGFKPVNPRSLAVPLRDELEELMFSRTGISTEKNAKYLSRIAETFRKGRWKELAREWRKAPAMFEAILDRLEEKERARSRLVKATVPGGAAGQGNEAEAIGNFSQAHITPSPVAADGYTPEVEDGDGAVASKRRRTESSKLRRLRDLRPRWEAFSRSLDQFERQVSSGGSGNFAFAFMEGKIVKAVKNGDWVLLDEINLASSDTLESIADLLQPSPSILLSETGEIERIQAHPDFRIFGAMNPATDVGKRDLPLGLRSRFTEIYVSSPDRDKKDLLIIIKKYLKGNNSSIDRLSDNIADLYLEIKTRAEMKMIVDQANDVPHFSLRTLARVLVYANDMSPSYGLERALYEGFCMCFTTLLSEESEKTVMPLIRQHLLKRASILSLPPKRPNDGKSYVCFRSNNSKDQQYWLLQGREQPVERADYIITPYVERNLLNLVRATSTRRYPILIQGPTSSGKTSMIEYLANYTGNKFVRINNHEHTDLQEYLGTYVSDQDGKLRFQEGLLVQAMREGAWIVLDELNLAPTDVLEALNRLLDDNRELFIPETQEVVRPAESFCLFATQNPPGLYGGRKMLSRAFRNRFLELHFDDIPEGELQEILQRHSRDTSPSDCRRIVEVYRQLTRLRQESRVFEQKNSFATLRDLFRWALREADTREDIAANGYMLLAERVRKPEEREAVRSAIEEVFKVKVEPDLLYDLGKSAELKGFSRGCENGSGGKNKQGVIWTRAMRRLYVLVKRAIRNNEPVLLVGETGCGKTTVCQLLAEFDHKELHIVNAHQNTETGDLIGSQRPVRNRSAAVEALWRDLGEAAGLLGKVKCSGEELGQWYRSLALNELARLPELLKARIHASTVKSQALFEWCDGSLVHAMKEGTYFLLDEISLADDSVLERLNSVLEPHRSLLLAEKGIEDSFVKAADGFQFFATMNPGGDFGKKELSPALRNRFTEIWVPALSEEEDVLSIVESKLDSRFQTATSPVGRPLHVAGIIVEFSSWFGRTFRPSSATAFSVRDILAWVQFMNLAHANAPVGFPLLHGAAMVFIDTIGASPSALQAVDPAALNAQRRMCLDKLGGLAGCDLSQVYHEEPQILVEEGLLTIGTFSVSRASPPSQPENDRSRAEGDFGAPTTRMNAMRVVRALQSTKPILLEGNPGVGKTTLITALASACGRPLTRINLSDQTDLMDLFGTDVPVEGAEAGHFAWKNAPFLDAMQTGAWVLLDEMNLASQTVLEGLNACLDHRGEVYVSELNQAFKRHPDFRLFAAQNPHHQGGGRKGLPSSFVNRFNVVYADVFTKEDLLHITAKKFEKISAETQHQLIDFITRLNNEVVNRKGFGSLGSPWEFNLRDILRWGDFLTSQDPLIASGTPVDFLDVVIRQRFRTERDRQEVSRLFSDVFNLGTERHGLYHDTNPRFAQVGLAMLERNALSQPTPSACLDVVPRLSEIESVLMAVKLDLPCILVGPSGSGKSALLSHVAALAGKALVVFPLNADVDTMDLIGGFEQADPHREAQACLSRLRESLRDQVLTIIPDPVSQAMVDLMGVLDASSKGDVQASYPILLSNIQDVLALGSPVPLPTVLASLLSETVDLLRRPQTLESPRFEWLDGVIVRAVETGSWLVLDNANLCSASVLDRLNSLLERPGGVLSVNEHSGPGGEPRIIRPHLDFRIFLTVDPRYGELSRAMRNRSIEIYLDVALDLCSPGSDHDKQAMRQIAPVEGSLQRYQTVIKHMGDAEMMQLAFDSLSFEDARVLSSFAQVLSSDAAAPILQAPAAAQWLERLLTYIQDVQSQPLIQATMTLYKVSSPDWTLIPLYPIRNSPMVRVLGNGERAGLACWLALCFELYFDIHAAEDLVKAQISIPNATKPSSLNRLQRSSIADRTAVVAKDSTVNAARFLASTLETIKAYQLDTLASTGGDAWTNWRERRSILRRFLLFWRRTFKSLTAVSFKEAQFQAHLTQGSNFLRNAAAAPQREPGIQNLLSAIMSCLERDFIVGFRLTTGLSMEFLWRLLRPAPIQDMDSLQHICEIEQLADRFDLLRWTSHATVQDLCAVQGSLVGAYAAIRSGRRDASGLVKELRDEMDSLEATIGDHVENSRPFFAKGFEALRQVAVLDQAVGESAKMKTATSVQGVVAPELRVLSMTPTMTQMRLESCSTTTSRLFQLVDYLVAHDSDGVHPWTGTVSESLLLKFESAPSSSLTELRSLDSELPAMARFLAKASEALATDALEKMNQLLLKMMRHVMSAHGDSLGDWIASLYEESLASGAGLLSADIAQNIVWSGPLNLPASEQAPWPHHLVDIIETHIVKALRAMAVVERGPRRSRAHYSSVAWVQFSIACLKLYVPDKIFDPYLRAQVEADFHRDLHQELARKISAACKFELAFTGRESSLRIDLLKEEMAEAEAEKPSTAVQTVVYRPNDAELRSLQGEFNNVLNRVVHSDVSSTHLRYLAATTAGGDNNENRAVDAARELDLVQQNVERLVSRLATGAYKAYQDVTVPLVNFLRCLQVGLSLSQARCRDVSGASRDEQEHDYAPLAAATPFLGGTVWKADISLLPLRSLEFLSFIQGVVAVEGIDQLPETFRHALYESLAAFHEGWSKKLEADRQAEETKASLYRFKGSEEDQEEFDQQDFDALFPDFDVHAEDDEHGEQAVQKNRSGKRHEARELSILLAEAHEKVFRTPRGAQETLQGLCRQIARKVAHTNNLKHTGEPGRDSRLFPATLMVFEEHVARAFVRSGVSSTKSYNFYLDANLVEARKLLGLVTTIRTRFRHLQAIDEIGHHQALADVVAGCDRVLEMAIDEPLACLLAPVERLYGSVDEWHEGGWALKVHKAETLAERLRDTICQWRRLELGSWAKLFGVEERKCYEDAKSWWFIAYGAVVLEPLAILQQYHEAQQYLEQDETTKSQNIHETLKSYAAKLLNILQSYLTSTSSIVGQFNARLDLLRQLKSQLDQLVRHDFPELGIIRDALENFIRYYARFGPKIREAIAAGRAPLDRSMKDVLLLTKWRDTNIDVLRESAKRSHQKLFRLVRKFRAVLGRPVAGIVETGLPDEERLARTDAEEEAAAAMMSSPSEYDGTAVVVCRGLIPSVVVHPQWERITSKPDLVGKTMPRLGSLPTAAVAAPQLVDDFIFDLTTSIAALKKETPAILTDENKNQINHLKSRKTRLFIDTLKTVRAMGFSRGLSTTILQRQGSTEALLVEAGLVQLTTCPEGSCASGSSSAAVAAAEYFFHRTADLAPRFRHAATQHSDDLSRADVGRCIGYLEGVLFEMVRQRGFLARTAGALGELEEVLDGLAALATASSSPSPNNSATSVAEGQGAVDSEKTTTTTFGSRTKSTTHARVVRWLIEILRFSLHLVGLHERLGELDHTNVRSRLEGWVAVFRTLGGKFSGLPRVPEEFSLSSQQEIELEVEQQLHALRDSLDALAAERPDLVFIIRQIQPWVIIQPALMINEGFPQGGSLSVDTLAVKIMNLASNVLVAIQTFQRTASQDLPTSTEDASWLKRYGDGLRKAIDSLHAKTLADEVLDVMRQLRGLLSTNNENHLIPQAAATAIASLLRVALPVLRQHVRVCQHNLERFASLHRATCRLGFVLASSFVRIAGQGFCAPREDDGEKGGNESGKLEGGTGLGDGDDGAGAEDISKDVAPDEDLSELAQDPKNRDQKTEDMEKEKDAVDMDNEEMEGDAGSVGGGEEEEEGKKTGDDKEEDDEDGEDDMDEEAGEVDDLDPTAVDEKMWDDEGGERAEKDQLGDKARGKTDEGEENAAAAENEGKDRKEGGQAAAEEEEEKKTEKGRANTDDDDEEEEEEEQIGQEQEEAAPQQQEELNRQDQNVQQSETLDLPDDMEINLPEDEDDELGGDDDNLDDLSEGEGLPESEIRDDDHGAQSEDGGVEEDEEVRPGEAEQDDDANDADSDAGAKEQQTNDDPRSDMDVDEDGEDEGDQDGEDDGQEKDKPASQDDYGATDQEHAVPSDEKTGGGPTGVEDLQGQDNNSAPDDQAAQSKAAQRDQGAMGEKAADQETSSGKKGALSSSDPESRPMDGEDGAQDNESGPDTHPFKKLGDALERWHRNRNRDIHQAGPDDDELYKKNKDGEKATDLARAEFQHLQDENAEADTQALGTAMEDEAKPMDDAMAIDEDENEQQRQYDLQRQHLLPEDAEDEARQQQDDDAQMQDADAQAKDENDKSAEGKDSQPGVTTERGAINVESEDEDDPMAGTGGEDPDQCDEEEENEKLEETQTHLSDIRLETPEPPAQRDFSEALAMWSIFQMRTHAMSVSLTSQLRLILTPSQATKLSGSFRTGKRLDIKKIIPYIASGYRRDKIWMRRAVPTKRVYQILLCVDDSSSMAGESGGAGAIATSTGEATTRAATTPGTLALESLVMVSRALAMLEAGSVGVLGFGTDVFVAHDLLLSSSSSGSGLPPFGASPDSGARVLQRFTFTQPATDILRLVRATIDHFREARQLQQQRGGGGQGQASSDLWQLALVLSDGLVQSRDHALLRPLLREAAEERVMVVFIVMDDDGGGDFPGTAGGGSAEARKTKKTSVLDLKEARFRPDGTPVVLRYLDSFPFPYYLIVRRLDDLPNALSGLLRTWFGEVNS